MFDTVSSAALNVALDGLAHRQRVIADNIANVDTPNFRANRVMFEDALQAAVDSGASLDSSGSLGVEPGVQQSLEPTQLNGNNVNLDHEVLSNVDTGLRYKLALRAVDAEFGLLRDVIKG